jgi:exopolyphosphatase/guanosine-5'-triphosphate,3'-diphosphate pyrophosphatase
LTARVAAAIDVGSNSICLVIVRRTPAGLDLVHQVKDNARLAAGIGPDGELTEPAELRLKATLERFIAIAAEHGCVPSISATAALRGATNGDEVAGRMPGCVRVLSGVEEASNTYIGARDGLGLVDRSTLVVDVGGGSTEFSLGSGARPEAACSVPIGALTLHRSAFGTPPWDHDMVAVARTEIRAAFRPQVDRFVGFDGQAIACSGTLKRVVRLLADASVDAQPGWELEVPVLARLVERLAAATTLSERLEMPGMDPARADIALAGALIYAELSEMLGITAWTVSRSGLRRGLILGALAAA